MIHPRVTQEDSPKRISMRGISDVFYPPSPLQLISSFLAMLFLKGYRHSACMPLKPHLYWFLLIGWILWHIVGEIFFRQISHRIVDALCDVEPASVTDHPIAKSGSVPGIINTCTSIIMQALWTQTSGRWGEKRPAIYHFVHCAY